jgi:hypothetical protein
MKWTPISILYELLEDHLIPFAPSPYNVLCRYPG